MSAAQWKRADRDYQVYRSAKRVWRQISDDERIWILGELGYAEPEAANARDENHDLSEFNFGKKEHANLVFIRNYPQSDHRQRIYKAKLASGNKRQDVMVRKHEKRLRSARFAKHEKRSQMRRRPSW